MKTFCLDTNVILDFCYRYYPKNRFETLWTTIHTCVSSGLIRLVISEHIKIEVKNQIKSFGYDEQIFENFFDSFKVQQITIEQYQNELFNFSTDIQNHFPQIKKVDENDFSNMAVIKFLGNSGIIITAEQGQIVNLDNPDYKFGRLKLPDVCNYYQIDCGNWLKLFNFIGLKI